MLAVVAVAVVAVAAAVHQRQPIRVVLSEEVALSASLVRELAFGVHLRLVRVPVPQHDHAPHRRGAKRLSQIHRFRARYKGKSQAGPRQQSASSARHRPPPPGAFRPLARDRDAIAIPLARLFTRPLAPAARCPPPAGITVRCAPAHPLPPAVYLCSR